MDGEGTMKKGRVTGKSLPFEWTVTWYFFGVLFFPVGTTTIICVTEGLHRSRGAGMVPNHMRRACTEAFVLGSSRCHVCVLQTEAPFSPSLLLVPRMNFFPFGQRVQKNPQI